jgi:hypothetical protein
MALLNLANLAVSWVLTPPSPANSGTTIVLPLGHGAWFPAAPFMITVWPILNPARKNNAEICKCTAISSDTLTVVRAQEGTTARNIVNEDRLAQTLTKAWLDQLAAFFQGSNTVSSNYAVADSDFFIAASGNITITLPTTPTGKSLVIKNTGGGTITIDAGSGATIDGYRYAYLTAPNEAVSLFLSAANLWLVF